MIPELDGLYHTSGTVILDPEQLEVIGFNYQVNSNDRQRLAKIELTLQSRSTRKIKTFRFDGIEIVYMPLIDGKHVVTIANNKFRQWEDRGEFEAEMIDQLDYRQVLFKAKVVSEIKPI